MTRCWIGLGGNQGSVAETFRRAITLLDCASGITVSQMSRLYTTSPVGAAAGPEFLNAVAELHSTLPPAELLAVMQGVETQLGRVRAIHWGPRTLDLDLLLYDQQALTTPTLTIPHPHMWYRRFVLDPLEEIAPELIHCRHGLTISQLRLRLLARPLPCSLVGGAADLRAELRQRLTVDYPDTSWQAENPSASWLSFYLAPAARLNSPTNPKVIDVSAFPTPPERTIREVLAAALDPVRVL